jgi:spore germination protein GerM
MRRSGSSGRRLPFAACSFAACCLAVLVLGACGVPLDDRTHTISSEDVPFELLDPSPTSTTSTTVFESGPTTTVMLEPVYLYFVRDEHIESVRRDSPDLLGVGPRLMLLAQALTSAEVAQGFRSAVPPGSVDTVSIAGGVATVDLSTAFTEVPAAEQVLAFAQITYTVLQIPGIGQVAFTLDTVPIQALDHDGTLIEGPATKENYDKLLVSR